MYSGVEDLGQDGCPSAHRSVSIPLHLALREETRIDHEAVDRAFGLLGLDDRARYGRFLRAHARILPAAEAAVDPAALLPGWQGRTAALGEDLAALGIAMPDTLPFPLCADDAVRWGAIYVIEGSRLGGAMLARSVPAGLPAAYLSARHGPGGWRNIQAALDGAADGEDAAWRARAIAAARATFAAYRAAADTETAHG